MVFIGVSFRGPRIPRGEALSVRSKNPVRDAQKAGHNVGLSRAVIDAKSTALQRRFTRLLADGASAVAGAAEHQMRTEDLLMQVKWACEGVIDDLSVLEAATNPTATARRDQIMRAAFEEIVVIAELSSGQALTKATWREALEAFRIHLERLVADATGDAMMLADLDLALERIEHIEKVASDALRSYLGYVSA